VIDKLELLLALAQEKHFGRAAEALGVTQPTLSAGLKQLEEALGVPLVVRSSRFKGFTPEGERVLAWARRIVGDSRALRQEVDSLKRGFAGDFRIACIPTALALVATLTAPFHAKFPQVRFVIRSRSASEIQQLIKDLEIEAGITYLSGEPMGRVDTVALCRERYRLVCSKDNRFANRETIRWAEMIGAPLCLLSSDTQNSRVISAELRKHGIAPCSFLEADSMIVLHTHVLTGGWVSIMPEKLADLFAAAGGTVHAVRIVDPELTQQVGLVTSAREPASPLTRAFRSVAREAATLANAGFQ
jgi:DNA-binding transcriptional LysR family regulator